MIWVIPVLALSDSQWRAWSPWGCPCWIMRHLWHSQCTVSGEPTDQHHQMEATMPAIPPCVCLVACYTWVTATIYRNKQGAMQAVLHQSGLLLYYYCIYLDREGVMQVLLKPRWLPPYTGTGRVLCRCSCNQGDCPYIQGQGGCHADYPATRVTAPIYRDKEGVMQIVLQPGWLPLYTGTGRVSCRLPSSQGDYHYIQGGGCHAGCPAVRVTTTIYKDRKHVMQVFL